MDHLADDPARVDARDHAGLPLPPLDRVDEPVEALMLRVPPRQPVELLLRAVLDQVHVAADLDPPDAVLRVDRQERRARVVLEVPALATLPCGVDQEVVLEDLAPDRLRLCPPVGQSGTERGDDRPLQEIAVGRRDRLLADALRVTLGEDATPPGHRAH